MAKYIFVVLFLVILDTLLVNTINNHAGLLINRMIITILTKQTTKHQQNETDGNNGGMNFDIKNTGLDSTRLNPHLY